MRIRTGNADFFLVAGPVMIAVGVLLAIWHGPENTEAAGTFMLVGGIWVVVALGVRAFYGRMHRRAEEERKLFETGVRALAVVESVRTTGTVLNKVNKQIDLQLRVQPAHGPEFPYNRRMFVPLYGLPRPGDLLEVAFDPHDPSRMALATDWRSDTAGGRLLLLQRNDAGSGQPAPGSAAHDRMLEQLERLERLRQSGALSHAEFQAQKARILAGREV